MNTRLMRGCDESQARTEVMDTLIDVLLVVWVIAMVIVVLGALSDWLESLIP